MRSLLTIALVIVPVAARAEPPGETLPIAASVPAPAPVSPIDAAASTPLAERGFTGDTALVPSRVEVAARYLFGFGGMIDLAGGIGRDTMLRARVGTDAIAAYEVGIVQVIARGDRWRIALDGSVRQAARDAMSSEASLTNPLLVRVLASSEIALGAVASACVDRGCSLVTSASGYATIDYTNNGNTSWVGIASASAGGARLRGMVEMLASPNASDGTINSTLVLEARLAVGSFAAELGAAFGTDDQDRGVFPIVGAGARF